MQRYMQDITEWYRIAIVTLYVSNLFIFMIIRVYSCNLRLYQSFHPFCLLRKKERGICVKFRTDYPEWDYPF